MLCRICNLKVKNSLGMSMHLEAKHSLTLLEYNIRYENFVVPECVICGKPSSLRKGIKFNKTCGNEKCTNTIHKNLHHTEETKEIIRKSQFALLKKRNGRSAWERRNQGKMSYLEQWFYDNVIIRFDLSNRFDIVNEYAEYPYFIDFAFLNIKLAVELDGKCHEQRLEHDTKRDKYLSSLGWKIFRIKQNDNRELKVKEFLSLIGHLDIPEKLFDDKVYKYKEIKASIKPNKKCPNCGIDINIQATRCMKCAMLVRRKVERPSKEELLKELKESNFTKVGKKYGVRDNTIRKWII